MLVRRTDDDQEDEALPNFDVRELKTAAATSAVSRCSISSRRVREIPTAPAPNYLWAEEMPGPRPYLLRTNVM